MSTDNAGDSNSGLSGKKTLARKKGEYSFNHQYQKVMASLIHLAEEAIQGKYSVKNLPDILRPNDKFKFEFRGNFTGFPRHAPSRWNPDEIETIESAIEDKLIIVVPLPAVLVKQEGQVSAASNGFTPTSPILYPAVAAKQAPEIMRMSREEFNNYLDEAWKEGYDAGCDAGYEYGTSDAYLEIHSDASATTTMRETVQ